MSVGAMARRLLGSRFQPVGEFYRSLFMDIDKIAGFLAAQLPADARCVEVGGGDGMLTNAILQRRPDVHMTMIDVAAEIGAFLDPGLRDRVEMRADTSVNYLARAAPPLDAIIIADVVHHVPAMERQSFFANVRRLCLASGCRVLLVKDVEPGTPRGYLSLLSDWYVTGDRGVSLVPSRAMAALMRQSLAGMLAADIATVTPDPPNYCLVARLQARG